jgi:dTDP-4-amino-4,6-dideoxygalactose transaminase
MSKLAIDGGPKVRETPLPARGLIGPEEKAAAMALFDQAIASGNAFGYGGPAEQQYEKDFAAYLGGGFADAVNSGSNAVYCALGALQLEPFSEVIVPPITDCGGIMPVALLGLVPVVADADVRSYNTCAEQIAPLVSERTRAIIVAHIAGDAVDMDPVLALARRHQLYVIEDCAQSHGTLYKGRLAGTVGDIAAFSTMFGKHHCTGGQGGVVFTRNETLHWQGKRFADRGKPFNLTGVAGNVVAGLNCNLNDLSAAIGSAQVKKLPAIIASRVRVGNAIRDALRDQPAVQVGWQVPDSQSSYWFLRMVVRPQALRVDKGRKLPGHTGRVSLVQRAQGLWQQRVPLDLRRLQGAEGAAGLDRPGHPGSRDALQHLHPRELRRARDRGHHHRRAQGRRRLCSLTQCRRAQVAAHSPSLHVARSDAGVGALGAPALTAALPRQPRWLAGQGRGSWAVRRGWRVRSRGPRPNVGSNVRPKAPA